MSSSGTKVLTIAIPTYNRPAKVLLTVQGLLKQLDDRAEILIMDNCSDVVIADNLKEHLTSDDLEKLTVVRNAINVGADANFARCYEYCTTPYIWIVGDDDLIEPDAVTVILSEIERYKDADLVGINFNSNCCRVPRDTPIKVSNVNDLVNKIDDFGNWLFISTSVYKTEEYLKYIRYAYWSSYSMSSQVVPALVAISKGKNFIFSEKYIVSNPPEDLDHKWSHIQLSLGLPMLLETPMGMSGDQYYRFGKKLNVEFVPYTHLFFAILRNLDFKTHLIDRYHRYIFKQLYHKTFEFRDNKIKHWILYKVCLVLLYAPALINVLLTLAPKLKQKASSKEYSNFHLLKR